MENDKDMTSEEISRMLDEADNEFELEKKERETRQTKAAEAAARSAMSKRIAEDKKRSVSPQIYIALITHNPSTKMPTEHVKVNIGNRVSEHTIGVEVKNYNEPEPYFTYVLEHNIDDVSAFYAVRNETSYRMLRRHDFYEMFYKAAEKCRYEFQAKQKKKTPLTGPKDQKPGTDKKNPLGR